MTNKDKAEEKKNRLIDFASQGGNEWTQSEAEDLIDDYVESKLQALRDPKKIREIMMGSDFEHLKINDEFGFTGEWRMSEKGVLDVIINLIDNNLNE